MPKPPAEDTELNRPANERVRPSLSWRNARQALHTRLAAFLGFAVLLTAVFIKPLFSLAAGAMQSQLDSYIILVPFVSAYLIYDRRKGLPKEHGFSSWAIIPVLSGIIALTTALKLHQPGPDLQCRCGLRDWFSAHKAHVCYIE